MKRRLGTGHVFEMTGSELSYLSEMPRRNSIKKSSAPDMINSFWDIIEDEVEDWSKYHIATLKGEQLYGINMKEFWSTRDKIYYFFLLKDNKPVLFASFIYEIEARAWIEDEVAKYKSKNSIVDLYKAILSSKKISFVPKRIGGKDHSKGMEKVWRNQLSKVFKTSVIKRENGHYFPTKLSIKDKEVWSDDLKNPYYVVIEK